MNILISAFACDPTKGSEPAIGWGTVYYHALAGDEIHCLTRSDNQANIETYLAEHPQPNLHVHYVEGNRITKWLKDRLPYIGIYPYYLSWQHRAYLAAKNISDTVSFDVIHHASYGSLQMGSQLWKLGVPFIFGPVGGGQKAPKGFRRYFHSGWKLEIIRQWISFFLTRILPFASRTLQHADKTLVVNAETEQLALELGAQDVQYFSDTGLKLGFMSNHYLARPIREEMKVVWLGRYLPRKGLLFLLDVFASLPTHSSIQLTLVGDGPDFQLIQARIQELGLGHRISSVGRVPFEQVKQYYMDSDVFVFSSLRDTYGSQLVEAMASGLPIVCLDQHGSQSFVPDEASIKVPVDSVEKTIKGMAEALIYLQGHPEERERMGRASHAYALTEQWPERIQRYKKLYRSLQQASTPYDHDLVIHEK